MIAFLQKMASSESRTKVFDTPAIRLVLQLLYSERNPIGVVVTYEVVIGVLSLILPIAVQTVVNTLAFTQLMQPLVVLAFAVLFGQVFGVVLKTAQVVLIEKMQRRIFALIGLELAYRIPRMLRLEGVQLSEKVNRFMDIVTIQKSISYLILEGFALALQILIGLVLLAFYHPWLLAFDLVLVAAIIFVLLVLGRNAIRTSEAESTEKYAVLAWLEELSEKVVTFSAAEEREFATQQANSAIGRYLEARRKHFRIVFRQVFSFLSLQATANTSLLILGAWLVSENQLSIGQLVASEIVVSTVMYSLARFQKHLDNFYDLTAALRKVNSLLSLPLEEGGKEVLPDSVAVDVQLVDVTYDYSSRRTKFGPISFSVKAGQHLAIHGSNGVGKSTIVDLLYDFKSPSSGVVLINDVDLRVMDPEKLRQRVALVRGVEIIQASIIDNVRLGNNSISIDEIHDVLAGLGLLEELHTLQDGLNTKLFEGGAPLTVSQSKRLMLARSLLRRPSLLLIDEILDGLDAKSRDLAFKMIFSDDYPRTVIITSQQAAVESECDFVLDLDKLREG